MRDASTLLVLMTVGLAACGTPLAWVKPAGDEPASVADQTDCQRLAWRQAVEMENDIAFRARLYHNPFSPYRSFGTNSAFNRYDWEDRFFSTCMQAKGYMLRPVAPGG